ncbi:MAG: choice-of-anchor B family protein [Bacteroidota bacterium]
MRSSYLFLVLLLCGNFAFGQQSLNLTLAGQVNSQPNLNDCWGWVGPNNTEYAIAGNIAGGEIIVDITNPNSPQLVQTLPGPPSTWRDMKTWGNYAYITNEASGGLRIIDLSGLPNNVVYKDTIIQGMNTSHNIYIDNGFAYIVGMDVFNGGMMMLDLSDPWFPNYVGNYDNRYVHDVYVRNNIAYAGELSAGLTIIDVNNKSNPQVIANRQYQGNFTHNTWLNDAGTVCFTTDEVTAGKITAFEISNLSNIELLDEIQSSLSTDGQVIPHNTHVLNDYLVTSYYRDGLNIIDAARPHNLIEVGYYDTSPLSGTGFDGNWGAYPFFPSGTIIASDMDDGLFVFQPGYIRGCYLEGEVTDASTTQPIANADIEIQGANVTDLSSSTGDYATGTAQAGTYNVKYSKFGYRDSTISTVLANGQLVIQDVPLEPLDRVSFTVNVIEEGSGNPIGAAAVEFREINGNANLPYTTNSGGIVTDPNFISATYTVIAGKWGYRTKEVQFTVNSTNNSLTIELPVGYYDDFALDFNWSVGGPASAGIWERGDPVGTSNQGTQYNPEDDLNFDIGVEAYVTGNGGGSFGSDDVDNGETRLISPVMDLSNYVEPVVKYYRWFANGGGFGGNPDDTLRIEIFNGSNTVVLNRVFGTNQNAWQQDTFVVSNFLTPTSNMRMRFICGDYNSGHVTEGAVDLFEVIDLLPNSVKDLPLAENAELIVSPNPLAGRATVNFDIGTEVRVENVRFEVRNVMGQQLFERQLDVNRGTFLMDLDLAEGIYIGSLLANDRVIKTFRIVK